jgi:two-component system NtrC family sensor kinase
LNGITIQPSVIVMPPLPMGGIFGSPFQWVINMHRLLERQIRRNFGSIDLVPQEWRAFIAAVDEAYIKADSDTALVTRSLDIMSEELNQRNEALSREKDEQAVLIGKLEFAHNQLLQSEKMASIGQLAAGVAHEINNPIGYVNSNISALGGYVNELIEMLGVYEGAEAALDPVARATVSACRARLDIDFLKGDIQDILSESKEGIGRVKKIVQDLKDFSHPDEGKFLYANVHHGISSTLNIVSNEIRYKADVITEFGDIPEVECILSQLNQVFMNLLVNAAHAMSSERRGKIFVRSGSAGDATVWIEIADDGCGIPAENLKKIFDPFFTTKPVGQGTGLGLSLSYGMVQKHHGNISVHSAPGQGTCFRITLPIRQPTD